MPVVSTSDRAMVLRWCAVALYGLLVLHDRMLVARWVSEPALWSHAVQVAPAKPRPVANVAKAAILSGQPDVAEHALYRLLAVASLPHVPGYDRDDALRAFHANLQTLQIMRAVAAP